MKTKISRIGKKSLSVVIALMMIVSTMLVGMVSVSASITGYSAIYFTPSSNWRQDKAIFKLEVDSNKIDFVCVDETNYIYKATLDSNTTYNDLKFLRINPNNTSETWNSSNKFSWISDDKSLNHYTMKDNAPWSSWDVNTNNGTWSAYSGGSGETTGNYYYAYWDANATINKFVQMDKDAKNEGSYIIRVSTNNSSYAPLTNRNQFKISNAQSTNADEANKILSESGAKSVNWSSGFSTSRVSKSDSLTGVTFNVDEKYHDLKIDNIGSNTDFYIQYTPSGTNGLDGNIKVWSVSDYEGTTEPTTPTPTTNYYIGGRFRVKNASGDFVYTYGGNTSSPWNAKSTDGFELKDDDGDGVYTLDTGCTVKELSQKLHDSSAGVEPYFLIHTGNGDGGTNVWYGAKGDTEATTFHNFETNTASNKANLIKKTGDNAPANLINFSDSTDAIKGTVTICFKPIDDNNNELWYTTEGSTPSGKYKLADKSGNYGKVEFKVGDNTVTSANEGEEVTATVIPNTGFNYVANSFSVTNDTLKLAVGTPTGTTLTFKMPASNVTATAKFTVNKAEYVNTLANGLYVDVAPDKNDTTATFVMWNNYTGSGQNPSSGVAPHNTKEVYTLYLPANVNLNSVTLYNAFDSNISFDSITISANSSNTVSLSTDKEYSFTVDSTTYKFNVMQGSTSSMFLYTNDGKGNDYNLPTSKKSYDKGLLDKETIKASGGLCTTIKTKKSEDGTVTHTLSDAFDLSQVKGRGNSSWKASCQLFGKYAFNMKLSSATSLFDLPKSKSFCLLANNMDDAMMRNAYIYQLAKDIGLYDSPEFEFVDIYDNGEYMGAYLVTEKVDVGKKDKLIKGNSIEKLNEDKGAVFDEDNLVHSDTLGYANIKNGVKLDSDTTFVETYQKTGTYLLEFEIPERVQNEPSYFKSSKGQHVVLKNPEFATKGEVEFIRDKFNEMEALVYPENNAKIDLEALSKVMDLDSFARMYLIQEFTSNLDSAATSYYITYDCSKGLFVASPVWDYDMALGQNKGSKKAKDGSPLYADNATAWFAKEKAMGDGTQSGSYSLQSKLATDPNFQTVIKKVWFGKNNDGFYDKVKPYYTNGGQLDTWKNQISKSISMNEERWGFIANNPARNSWGSPDTTDGKGFTGAVDFLKTSWSSKRGTWLNNEFNKYSNYTQIATPTLTAYDSDGKTALTGTVTAGDTYVLKATTPEIYVDYVLYDDEKQVGTANTTGVFKIDNATAGTHSYTVKTVYNSAESNASSPVEVTVSEALEISGVSISTPKTTVNVDEEFTLTATVSPNGLTGVTYTFYKDGNAIADATNITSNTYKTKITAEGSAVYKVAATLNGKTVESDPVTVTAEIAPINKEVTIYFKSASASAYVPSLSVDGSTPAVMIRNKIGEQDSTYFGSTYSGSLKFYWFYTTMTIDASKAHTLVFTTKDNRVNAKKTYTFSPAEDNKYYFAVNNLMGDTNLVDLTDKAEYIRNYHISATHMVHSTTYDNNVGFTWMKDSDGNYKEYAMGTYLEDNSINTASLTDLTSSSLLTIPSALTPNAMLQASTAPSFFTIKSATLAQRITADISEVSTLQYQLLDVNLDGVVDVKDSTMMQKALANF